MPTAARPVGTLFYSPAERQAIETQRHGEATATGAVPSTHVQFAGQVRRERGKGTVWLNNRPLPEGQAGVLKQPPAIISNGILIDGQSLRVGETLDLSTGQRADVVPPGAIARKRAP
jgi:hypothetical protein